MYLLHQAQLYIHQNACNPRDLHVVFCDHQTREQIHAEKKLVRDVSTSNSYHEYVYTGDIYTEESLRKRRHSCFVQTLEQT